MLMKITFWPGYDRSETLTNFPALCIFGTNVLHERDLSYSQMASTQRLGSWCFLNSNQTQTLNYEIEKWNPNGSSYVLGFKVPQLFTGTWIWDYWGETNLAAAPTPTLTNGAVWTEGYSGVWHLARGSGVSGVDATKNGNNGAVHNLTATNGIIGDAGWFDGASAFMDLGTSLVSMTVNQQTTISAWVYPLGGTVLLMNGTFLTRARGVCRIGMVGKFFPLRLHLREARSTDWLGDGGSVPPGQWSYVNMIISGGTKSTYVNGILKGTRAFTGTPSVAQARNH